MPGRAGGGSVSRQRASPVNADRQKDFTFHTTRARPDSEQEVLPTGSPLPAQGHVSTPNQPEVEAVLPVARARPLTCCRKPWWHSLS
jgi:hypothetical protein